VEKVPPIEIHRRMQAVYCDQCDDVSTVRCWVRRFRDGELGFKNKTPIFFKDGFKKLVQRWWKCIEVLVILWKNNYAALKITDVGIFLFLFH
jgi:hypothetical protein